jgi:hypothetical protein
VDLDTSRPRPPLVPGLVLERLLGRGAHGHVWAARDAATGDRVAVKVGRRPDDPTSAREPALLARLEHQHVVRLRNVVDCPDGTRALVLDLAEGGSLAGLVAARGRLDPGETVTVTVALARTLADLHARGLVHGDLTPSNVLLTADGRPLLADLGVAGVLGSAEVAVWATPGFADLGPGPAADPVRDVHALGALVRFCLTGSAGPAAARSEGATLRSAPGAGALLAVADLCTDADPARRPDAATVARLAWDAAPARPLRPADAAGSPACGTSSRAEPAGQPDPDQDGASPHGDTPGDIPGDPSPHAHDVTRRIRASAVAATTDFDHAVAAARTRRRTRLRRWVRTAALLAAAVTLAGGSVVAAATLFGKDAAADAAGPSDAQVTATVERLAAHRAAALGAASTTALAAADEPGSPALAADAALLTRLGQARLRLDGLAFTVTDVRVVDRASRPRETLTVSARVATSAHRQVRRDGTVAARVPAAQARAVRLVLVRTAAGWRVRSASPPAGTG